MSNQDIRKESLLDSERYAYRLHKNDIVLRMLFGQSKTRNVLKYLHSPYMQLFIILTILIFVILRLLTEFFGFDQLGYKMYFIYILSISCIVWIPLEILWISTVNRIGFKLLARSFVFWLQIIFSLFYGITHFIYTYLTYHSSLRNLVLFSYGIFNLLTIPLAILWISMFDAININKIWKMIPTGILGSMFLFFSINYEFLVSQKDDYFVKIPIINQSFSFFSVMASSLRILCIFSLKHFFLIYYYPNKCVTIRYTPYLIWYKTEIIDADNVLYTINLDENIQNEASSINNRSLKMRSEPLLRSNVHAYKFNENDIYLYKWFGGQIAKNILTFLHKPLNQFLTTLSMLGFIILRVLADFIYPTDHLIYFIYAIYLTIICYLIWFPLQISWVAICNRSAFKLLLHSFEFWFKVGTVYLYTIPNLIYNYQIHDVALNKIDLICYSVFNVICIPMVVVCVSILDCIPGLHKIWKMTFSGITASIFFFFSIHYEFSIGKEDDYIVTVPYIHDRYISFCSLMASAGRILVIFMFKQFLMTYYYHYDKCVLIRYTPHLIWDSGDGNIDDSIKLHKISMDAVEIQLNDGAFNYYPLPSIGIDGKNKIVNEQKQEEEQDYDDQ